MLILNSILSFCQNTDTKNINCFDNYQIEQFYKGLKQGEFLKDKLKDAELTINLGDTLIQEQSKQIENQKLIIDIQQDEKNSLLNQLRLTQEKHSRQLVLKENEIKILQNEGKKKFNNGLKTGGIIGVAIVAIGVILIN